MAKYPTVLACSIENTLAPVVRYLEEELGLGRAVQVDRCLRIDRAWYQCLKLECGEPLSNSAFNVNFRRYSWGRIGR